MGDSNGDGDGGVGGQPDSAHFSLCKQRWWLFVDRHRRQRDGQGTKEGLRRFAQAALQPDTGVVSFDFPAIPDFPSTTFASVYGD